MRRPFAILLAAVLAVGAFFVVTGLLVKRHLDDVRYDYYVDLCDDSTDDETATAALRLTGEKARRVPEQEAVAETKSDETDAEQERLAKAAKEKEEEQFLLMQLQLQQQQQAQLNAMMMQMMNTPMPSWTPTPSPAMPSRRSFQSQGYCALHQCHYTMGIGMGGGCPKCNTASYGLDARARCPRCGQEFDFTFGHTCLR